MACGPVGISPSPVPASGGPVTVTGVGFAAACSEGPGGIESLQIYQDPGENNLIADITTFTVVDDNTITAVFPAEPGGTYYFQLLTNSRSPSLAFSYAQAGPAVTGLAPAIGPLGGGTSVTITAAGLTLATGPAADALSSTTCTGTSAITYTPGLTNTPQQCLASPGVTSQSGPLTFQITGL